MHLKIITHEKLVFDEDVDEIYTRAVDGEFVTKIKQGSSVKFFTTMGGVLQFKDGECTILTTTAEAGNDIDVARAEAALRRAKQRLEDNDAAIDSKRAEAAVARAMARLKATLNR